MPAVPLAFAPNSPPVAVWVAPLTTLCQLSHCFPARPPSHLSLIRWVGFVKALAPSLSPVAALFSPIHHGVSFSKKQMQHANARCLLKEKMQEGKFFWCLGTARPWAFSCQSPWASSREVRDRSPCQAASGNLPPTRAQQQLSITPCSILPPIYTLKGFNTASIAGFG